jgi:hypothetical protein
MGTSSAHHPLIGGAGTNKLRAVGPVANTWRRLLLLIGMATRWLMPTIGSTSSSSKPVATTPSRRNCGAAHAGWRRSMPQAAL